MIVVRSRITTLRAPYTRQNHKNSFPFFLINLLFFICQRHMWVKEFLFVFIHIYLYVRRCWKQTRDRERARKMRKIKTWMWKKSYIWSSRQLWRDDDVCKDLTKKKSYGKERIEFVFLLYHPNTIFGWNQRETISANKIKW